MAKDPYSVLGVSREVSDEELKKQYRILCRKYHPDVNPNNPQAEEKFKEVQQAYQQIMDEKKNGFGGPSYGGYRGYGSQSYGGGSQSEDDIHMSAALNYIRSGHYQEAINVLDGISDHTARWFYFYAYANYGMGNNVAAQQYAQTAVNMEPNNMEYRQLLQQLQMGMGWYQEMQRPYQTYRVGGGNFCLNLCIANLVCSTCCGGRICFC